VLFVFRDSATRLINTAWQSITGNTAATGQANN